MASRNPFLNGEVSRELSEKTQRRLKLMKVAAAQSQCDIPSWSVGKPLSSEVGEPYEPVAFIEYVPPTEEQRKVLEQILRQSNAMSPGQRKFHPPSERLRRYRNRHL